MLKLKRILLSVSLFGTSLLTMVATTFAWVGITSNSVFDEFSLSLKTDNDTGNYGIQLSLTGEKENFYDSIDGVSIRRQILKNTGRYDVNMLKNASDDKINSLFSRFEMGQCTPCPQSVNNPNLFSSNEVQTFENVSDGSYSSLFMWFDVYASLYVANSTVDPSAETAPISLFLRDGILSSNEIGSWKLHNPYTYPTTPFVIGGVPYTSPFAGKTIHDTVRVNPASAARVCIQKFAPVDLNYVSANDSTGYTIYKYDDDVPYYDNVNDIYSFGGILPTEHNMAQQQFGLVHPDIPMSEVPEWQINRGDVKYEDVGNVGRIVWSGDNNTPGDGLTVGKKIKFRVYFWFEGWDADCFEVIDRRSVNVNLAFSNKGPSDI